MATSSEQPRHPRQINRRRLFLGLGRRLLIFVLCLFLPAGTLAWTRGWLFLLVIVVSFIVGTSYLRRVNPDAIVARIKHRKATKRWDRIVLAILRPTVLAILIVAALDDGRFHWSHVPWWGCVLGYALVIAGVLGLIWAQSVSKFFEPTVRIQTGRGHTVIDTVPYAIVRHPGYVAASLLNFGIPLSLGSFWALIPAALTCLLLVVRTVLEDKTLRNELPGYEEYTQRVRYRLVPGVW
jgi:protein-S-isoprenylcysteine O-methyltransferase Ste14